MLNWSCLPCSPPTWDIVTVMPAPDPCKNATFAFFFRSPASPNLSFETSKSLHRNDAFLRGRANPKLFFGEPLWNGILNFSYSIWKIQKCHSNGSPELQEKNHPTGFIAFEGLPHWELLWVTHLGVWQLRSWGKVSPYPVITTKEQLQTGDVIHPLGPCKLNTNRKLLWQGWWISANLDLTGNHCFLVKEGTAQK